MNQSLFSQLQKNAFIINLARGSHLIEQDLLAALESGQVAGASLDVFASEPLPQMHPFGHTRALRLHPILPRLHYRKKRWT